MFFLYIIISIILVILAILLILFIYDRFFQTDNLVKGNFPVIGRFRYLFYELRPFLRQYFGDDNAFTSRIVIDWIASVARGKSGYFSFDKFDTTYKLDNGDYKMIHSSTPLNEDEIKEEYPKIGKNRKNPMNFNSYFYRSAMSLGAIGFEATSAMAAACADAGAPFNTGEGGFSVHHIPRVKFSYDKKFFKYIKAPSYGKFLLKINPSKRLEIHIIDFLGKKVLPEGTRDLYLFDKEYFVFYTIDREAPLEYFPKPEDLDESYGHIIYQIGSGLYGLRKDNEDGTVGCDLERFQKVASFCRAVEIKLAQGAKQSGGVLKANKNTEVISEIRGVPKGIDLISPNRFPYYEQGKEGEFFNFIEQLSDISGGKPVGVKTVISDESNIQPFAEELAKNPNKGPDFITIDGGDGGSGAAPIHLSVLFGKRIYDALDIVNNTLKNYNVRDKIKVFASSKLYSPHMSAKAFALGADAVGNARSIMIAGGCIRAGLCSGEYGDCPVGLATMKKQNRRAYAQAWDKKVEEIARYIKSHNKGLLQVAAISGVENPLKLGKKHIAS